MPGLAAPELTAVVAVVGVAGIPVGALLHRAARAYPWRTRSELVPVAADGAHPEQGPAEETRGPALGRSSTAGLTAALFGLAALRFGPSAQLPAFLAFATAGVLLTAVDLRHHVLPDRVVLPSVAAGAVLLILPAAVDGAPAALLRALLAAASLFAGYLLLALLAPGGLGMGDVKLAALLGLYLGWLGWNQVLTGAVAGFVVQAVVALSLLAVRRIGLRGELPFGPAMLVGALVGMGWGPELVHGVLGGNGLV